MFPWLDLVPLAAYLLTGVGVRSWRRHGEGEPWGWREAWLIAAVLLAVWVAAGTEILSAFGALRFWPVLLWWGVPIVMIRLIVPDLACRSAARATRPPMLCATIATGRAAQTPSASISASRSRA